MHLLEETLEAQEMRAHILLLLSSKELENQILAFQLMKGGGVHPSFIIPLWVIYYDLPTEHKRMVKLLLRRVLDTFVFGDKDVFAMDTLESYDIGCYQAIETYLCGKFPTDCTAERMVRAFFPRMDRYYKYYHFYPLYQRIPSERVFLLRELTTDDGTGLYLAGLTFFTTLPEEIGELQELVTIKISNSSIGHLPESFYTLKNLRYFFYEGSAFAENKKEVAMLLERMPTLETKNELDY